MTSYIPYDPVKVAKLREYNDKGLIVGLGDVTGILERKDIDVLLHEEPATFNLFVQAFIWLKDDKNIDKPTSFFQLAGIHGQPQLTWNKKYNNQEPRNEEGYCEHGTVLFPTWHRPYLTALEQALYLRMVDIALEYTNDDDRNAYLEAVQKFRLPYWDYYRPREYETIFQGIISKKQTKFPFGFHAPQIFTLDRISIRKAPTNEFVLLDFNPFKNYNFPDVTIANEDDDYGVKTVFKYNQKSFTKGETYRHPRDHKDFVSDVEALNLWLNERREAGLEEISGMLLNPDPKKWKAYSKYRNFASTGAQQLDPDTTKGSLENVHNAYHGIIGGWNSRLKIKGGQMGDAAIAAFDPIFWFHHVNIDRWLSVWQAINTDWLTPKDLQRNKNSDTKLTPFLTKDATTYWNSSVEKVEYSSRYASNFGYTYPDIVEGNPEQTKANFAKLESWSLRGKDPVAPEERRPLDLSKAWVFDKTKYTPPKPPSGGIPDALPVARIQSEPANPKGWSWYADIDVERMALNGSFGIYYFVKEKGEDKLNIPKDAEYGLAPTLAGFTYIFTASSEDCANCAQQAEDKALVTGTAVITPLLQDYVRIGDLQSLEPADVKPFLIERLVWRVITHDGRKIDPRELVEHQLNIGISSTVSQGAPGEEVLVVASYPDVIEAIIGGASQAAGVV